MGIVQRPGAIAVSREHGIFDRAAVGDFDEVQLSLEASCEFDDGVGMRASDEGRIQDGAACRGGNVVLHDCRPLRLLAASNMRSPVRGPAETLYRTCARWDAKRLTSGCF